MLNKAYSKSPELLTASSSRLLVIDVQERLLPIVPGHERIEVNCVKLLKAAELLNVSTHGAEQYPKGLGATVEALTHWLPSPEPKVRFSAAEVFEWVGESTSGLARHQIVIAGIETHVCILQTAFDLLAAGFDVFIVVDAVGSRHQLDHEVAVKRLADAGAKLVTTEMVLFEWCEVAGTDQFKTLSKIVTGRS